MAEVGKVCRLCLDLVTESSCDVINVCLRGMLRVISLNLNFARSETPVACIKCVCMIQQSFEFKTISLINAEYLKRFLHSDATVKLTLEEIFRRNSVESDVQCEDPHACRLCLRFVDTSTFEKLYDIEEDESLKDMLRKCLPEIDMNYTIKPLLCDTCLENIQNQFNFVTDCLNNDEKIDRYVLAAGIDSNTPVDLRYVLIFMLSESTGFVPIKADSDEDKQDDQEGIDDTGHNTEIKKNSEEEKDGVKIEKNNSFIDDNKAGSNRSSNNPKRKSIHKKYIKAKILYYKKQKFYQCQRCNYRTASKLNLSQHTVHRFKKPDSKKLQRRYRCENCSYTCARKYLLRWHSHERSDDAELQKTVQGIELRGLFSKMGQSEEFKTEGSKVMF